MTATTTTTTTKPSLGDELDRLMRDYRSATRDRLRQRCRDEIAPLALRYARKLARKLADGLDPDDAAQIAMLRLDKAIDTWDPDRSKATTWLAVQFRGAWAPVLRAQDRRAAIAPSVSLDDVDVHGRTLIDLLAARGDGGDDVSREMVESLIDEVWPVTTSGELGCPQRRAVILRFGLLGHHRYKPDELETLFPGAGAAFRSALVTLSEHVAGRHVPQPVLELVGGSGERELPTVVDLPGRQRRTGVRADQLDMFSDSATADGPVDGVVDVVEVPGQMVLFAAA